MSDAKPRRAARDAARGEPVHAEAAARETAPNIVPEAAPKPEAAVAAAMPQPAIPAVPEPAEQPAPAPAAAADDAWAALSEAQAVLARGFEELAAEMVGMTRSGLAAAADAAVALVGARTFAEAVEINAGLARRGVDTMIEASARLSEIGIKAASEASRPILSRLTGIAGLGGG